MIQGDLKPSSKTKDGVMLFSFNNLEVKISSETKTLFVFIQPERLNLETLFELEGLTQWLQSHIEVQSVVISNEHALFPLSPSDETLGRWSVDQLKHFQQKLSRVVWAFHKVPQTVIADCKMGTDSFGIELALCADIVLLDYEGEMHFDYLEKGIVPMSGGVSLLAEAVGAHRARRWLLSTSSVSSEELEACGWIQAINDREQIVDILKKINQQSSIARIQLKRQWQEWFSPIHNKIEEVESPFALAAHQSEDYQRPFRQESFANARDVALKMRAKSAESSSH